jgi:hypothetical protein
VTVEVARGIFGDILYHIRGADWQMTIEQPITMPSRRPPPLPRGNEAQTLTDSVAGVATIPVRQSSPCLLVFGFLAITGQTC